MASGETQEPGLLHERLREQVSLSIRESLEKATTVLSNLHRVQSYFDVIIRNIAPSRGAATGGGAHHTPEGIKNALEQIRTIRADAATLLQTVYLTEIGLQSLQDFDKQGGSGGLSSLMPILGEAGLTLGGTPTGVELSGEEISFVGAGEGNSPGGTDGMPPAKKINLGVSITSCTVCSRKFAAQRASDSSAHLCRKCRGSGGPPQASIHTMSLRTSSGSTPAGGLPVSSSTPAKSKQGAHSGRRTKLPPLTCKLCGVTFIYRRCLLRHVRETHSEVDINDIFRYVEQGSVPAVIPDDKASDISQTSSLNVTVGSDVPPASALDETERMDTTPNTTSEQLTSAPQDGLPVTVEKSISEQPSDGRNNGGDLLDEMASGSGGAGLAQPEGGGADQKEEDGDKDKTFTCSFCDKSFDRPYRLQRHMQIHNPNRPRVSCQICDRSFTRLDTLQNHMRCIHSEDRPFNCSVDGCQKAFGSHSALVHHLRTHMDGKPYKCMECDGSFVLLNEYKQHMRENHADTQDLRCSDCYKLFPDSAGLDQHRQMEHRLECELCGKTFARLAYLQAHVEVHEGDHLFNCRVCNSGFETEYAYKQHIKIHPEYHRPKKSQYQCQLCEQSFQHPSNLVAHYSSEEHREKADALGISSSILNTIEGEDLEADVQALVEEVTMGTASAEDSIIQSIAESKAFQPGPSSGSGVLPQQDSLQSITSE